VYVGDNYVSDVEGAHHAGWRTIWLNPAPPNKPDNRADATVQTLAEIPSLFPHD
jgi:FMN phosphatase YigB (HAD superfamily)